MEAPKGAFFMRCAPGHALRALYVLRTPYGLRPLRLCAARTYELRSPESIRVMTDHP
jgi:hypothetical protein